MDETKGFQKLTDASLNLLQNVQGLLFVSFKNLSEANQRCFCKCTNN